MKRAGLIGLIAAILGCAALLMHNEISSLGIQLRSWLRGSDNVNASWEKDWKTAANEQIEQLRKRNVEIEVVDLNGNPLPGATVRAVQRTHQFGFGTAINRTALSNPVYADFVKNRFEWVTFENEAKWLWNEAVQGRVYYREADQLLEFARQNGLKVRGHNLFWEAEKYQPQWVKSLTGAALKEAIDNRLNSAVLHFKGNFLHWDVNNEMFHGSFFKDRLGEEIWTYMYKRTRELDPGVKLFVNDYNFIEYPPERDYNQVIQALIDRGMPIDGIGAQGHFNGVIDPLFVKGRLDKLAELNLPIWITEFDSTHKDERVRADNLEKMYRLAFAHPAVEGIVMWGFWAGSHWKGTDGAIVNQDWTLNAAGQRYQQLMDEWTTVVEGTTDQRGMFSFRGFHGTYDMLVDYPGAAAVKQSFTLEPGSGNAKLHIPFDVQDKSIPEAPAKLSAAAADSQVMLSWSKVNGATGYTVKSAVSADGPYTPIAHQLLTETFTHIGLVNRKDYYYVVSASNHLGESPDSAPIRATPRAAGELQTNLVLQYRSADGDNNYQIKPQFTIKNAGKVPIPLSELTIRYYFTPESTQPVDTRIDWAQFGAEHVQTTVVPPSDAAAHAYVELSFLESAGAIPSDTTLGNIQLRIFNSDGSSFDKTNDYSFDPTKKAYTAWEKVTLYRNGELVWGIEPWGAK